MPTFFDSLQEDLANLSERLEVSPDRAFAMWYGLVGLRLEEQEAVDAASYDGGNDRGIDMFLVDDELERVVIVQSKNLGRPTRAPKPGDLSLLLDAPDELQDPQELKDAGRQDLAEAAQSLTEARERGYTLELHLVYPGEQRDELDRKVRQFNRRNSGDGISASIVRLSDLEALHADYLGVGTLVDHALISLAPGTYHRETGPYGDSLVATIPGTALKELYQEHGMRLFDQNVRLFLGTRKGSVNAGIQETLGDRGERPNFWAYNNGITMVVKSFDLDETRHVVEVDGLSIVNGCQTTVSIGNASDSAAKDVAVLGRIVAARQDLVNNIIQFTNSQTPINVWDLSARDKTQKRLQEELDALDPPWFYALRRGELEALANKKRYGSYRERRVLPFPLSAQYLAAFKQLPVEAYKDKARLFTVHKEVVFPPDVQARDLLWAWHAGLVVDEAIRTYRSETDVDDVADLVLKRGGRFFITAIMSHLLALRNGEDFVAKINVGRLSQKAMKGRLAKYARMAVSIYVDAMKDLVGMGADVATLVRSTDTFRKLRDKVQNHFYQLTTAQRYLEEALPKLPDIR